MRRAWPLAALAAAVCAGTLVGLLAPVQASIPLRVERYGIVRVDAYGTWTILSNSAHQPSGLTGVHVDANGNLVVTFTPLAAVGVFVVDEDERYTVNAVTAGASVGLDRFVVSFAKNGLPVRATSTALRIANSNVQLWVVGTAPDAPVSPPPSLP